LKSIKELISETTHFEIFVHFVRRLTVVDYWLFADGKYHILG